MRTVSRGFNCVDENFPFTGVELLDWTQILGRQWTPTRNWVTPELKLGHRWLNVLELPPSKALLMPVELFDWKFLGRQRTLIIEMGSKHMMNQMNLLGAHDYSARNTHWACTLQILGINIVTSNKLPWYSLISWSMGKMGWLVGRNLVNYRNSYCWTIVMVVGLVWNCRIWLDDNWRNSHGQVKLKLLTFSLTIFLDEKPPCFTMKKIATIPSHRMKANV